MKPPGSSRLVPNPGRTLWICFTSPDALPDDDPILSFVSPDAEAALEQRFGDRVLSGRAIAAEVRAEARAAYIDLVARIAATPLEGQTLREALTASDGTSRWWFVKTSEKDCEWPGDLYTTLIRLLCVKRVADAHGARRVVLHGAPAGFARIVRRAYGGSPAPASWLTVFAARALALGVAARARLIAKYLRLRLALGGLPRTLRRRVDVLLHAQWGWSVRTEPDGRLRDRYFTDLPAALTGRGLTVAWLALCEMSTTGATGRAARGIRGELASHPDVVPLERYLTWRQIVGRAADVSDVFRFLAFARRPAFRALFVVEGFDLYPELSRQIVELLAGSAIPRLELIASGAEAACRELRPAILLTFLELFLQSRALYAGARRLPERPRLWAAQHAAYGRDKLFGVVEPKRELRGEPDGLGVPAPDGVFVMGELSRDIWLENGFGEDAVVVTGGLRYQHVRIARPAAAPLRPRPRILLIGSLNVEADLDMCEAAVAAVASPTSVELAFRNHPAFWLSATPRFARYRDMIAPSRCELAADLDGTDLVLFNHSSVAEEAILRGIPAWQWLWAGVNESSFLDLPVVPRFTAAGALREALVAWQRSPETFRPSLQAQDTILRQCFGSEPDRASDRIADHVAALVRAR